MITSDAGNQRLLVVAIDGLSKSELKHLAQYINWAKQMDDCLTLTTQAPCLSTQSVWAEILTGYPWQQLDCPGHARPKGSLNFCEFVSEDGLNQPVSVIASKRGLATIAINMPLLKPGPRNRIWLSDGSQPIHTVVSPATLLKRSPFDTYRPRPFSSCGQALLDLPKSVDAALHTESRRLDCALDLIESTNWQICFLRISVFDVLSHLLGPDCLTSQSKFAWPQIKIFLSHLDKTLSKIAQHCVNDQVAVLSTFHHTSCHGRLNLNALLAGAGLCQVNNVKSASDKILFSRRRHASIALAGDAGENAQAIAASPDKFDAGKTLAASPVSGAIYINQNERFADGIVASSEYATVTKHVQDWLTSALTKEFGQGDFVHCPKDRKIKSLDLAVSIAGVELHDSPQARAVDRENHPRSTHQYEGFVWLQNMGKSDTVDRTMGTIELHRRFLAAIE